LAVAASLRIRWPSVSEERKSILRFYGQSAADSTASSARGQFALVCQLEATRSVKRAGASDKTYREMKILPDTTVYEKKNSHS
jgi:hypothetical protein